MPNSNQGPDIFCSAWLLLAATAASVAAVESGVADIRRDATVIAVEQVMPSVVNIATRSVVPVRDPMERAYREFWHQKLFNEYTSLGSGVVIDEAGYLLTNSHVVRGANQIAVRFGTGTNDYSATLVAEDPNMDVALLKLNGKPGEKFHAIRLAREDDLLLGETVLALGNPYGLGGSVTRGILSSKSRRLPKEGEPLDIPNWLQTDAPINPGNSGGPLVNLRGELIGINVAVLNEDPSGNGRPVQGIGFAIPIRLVEEALTDFPREFVKSGWFGARVKVGLVPADVRRRAAGEPGGPGGIEGRRRGVAGGRQAAQELHRFRRVAGDQRGLGYPDHDPPRRQGERRDGEARADAVGVQRPDGAGQTGVEPGADGGRVRHFGRGFRQPGRGGGIEERHADPGGGRRERRRWIRPSWQN